MWRRSAQGEVSGQEAVARRIYWDALAEIDADTICLAVGEDNYCYPNWHRQSVFHETARERGATSFFWGCSIQTEAIDQHMETVLQGHDQYAISQCEVLICCRTHASIVGYSTGVPTLVARYSIKSQGIALDLGMGRWMLPSNELKRLPGLAEELWCRRNEIKENLLKE